MRPSAEVAKDLGVVHQANEKLRIRVCKMDVSALSSPSVSKTSPKTRSYDPIMGSPIEYDFSGGKYQRMSPPQQAPSKFSYTRSVAGDDRGFRSSISPASSPFRESRGMARVGSMTLVAPVPAAPIFAKTRQRSEFTNPITGAVTRYEIKRSNFRGLDNVFKTHLASSYEPVEVPYSYKPASTISSTSLGPNRIAGALKKSPEVMTYVNPYSLNTSSAY